MRRGLLLLAVLLGAGRAAAQPASQPVALELPQPYFAKGPAAQAAADLALERWQAARDGFLRPELAYVAAVGPRAAVATIRAPEGAEVVMEIAS